MPVLGSLLWIVRLWYSQIVIVDGVRQLQACLVLFAAATYGSTVLRFELGEATLLLALGASAWKIPFVPVGISLSAFLGLILTTAFWKYFGIRNPAPFLWFIAVVGVTAANSEFVGSGIRGWVFAPAVACAIWGIACFYKTRDHRQALGGTFAMAYGAVLIGADTIHLWPNMRALGENYRATGLLSSIGGAGWGDGLILIPLFSLTIVLAGVVCIVVGQGSPPKPIDPWKRRIWVDFIPTR